MHFVHISGMFSYAPMHSSKLENLRKRMLRLHMLLTNGVLDISYKGLSQNGLTIYAISVILSINVTISVRNTIIIQSSLLKNQATTKADSCSNEKNGQGKSHENYFFCVENDLSKSNKTKSYDCTYSCLKVR